MEISEKAEEILERLWIESVEGESDFVVLKKIGDKNLIEELLQSRNVILVNDKVKLTEKGFEKAKEIIRRHRLAERLLYDVLDIDEEEMEVSACKFEHILSRDVTESICTLLGHPRICPHGKDIPEGKCCGEERRAIENIILPLSNLKGGQFGKISYIMTKNDKKLKRLMAMDILPGENIEVIQTFPTYVFKIDQTQIAVDKDIANDIFIRIVDSNNRKG